MPAERLLKRLNEVISHPETPYFVTNTRHLTSAAVLKDGVGASIEFKSLLSSFVQDVDSELKTKAGTLNQDMVKKLQRNGYKVSQGHPGVDTARCEIVFPDNRLRIAVG